MAKNPWQALSPSNHSIFTRSMLMAATFIALLALSLSLVIFSLGDIIKAVAIQQQLVEEQNTQVSTQNNLVAQQNADIQRMNLILEANAVFGRFIYWRFESVITLNDRSVKEGDLVEKRLREIIAEISTINEDMLDVTDTFLIDLDDFNTNIQKATKALKDGNKAVAENKVGSAQSNFITMASLLEFVSTEFSAAVEDASQGVKAAADNVNVAAQGVSDRSAQIKAQSEGLQANGFLVLVIAVAAGLVIGTWFSRSLVKPIARLNQVIREIDENSDLVKRVDLDRQDEIGQIADSFDRMVERFEQLIIQLAHQSKDVSATSKEGAEISQLTSTNLHQLRTETDMVAAAITEMTSTVQGISDNTSHTADLANLAEQHCHDGQSRMSETGEGISSLNQKIAASADTLANLEEQTNAIGQVLEVINGISEQTNLLALNAAIEAARAGEQGRGFAVVADEVRTLAQRTADSTKQIQSTIEDLQSGSETAVADMTANREAAGQVLETANRAIETVNSILSVVQDIRTASDQISSATKEQVQASTSIDQSVTTIAELTNKVSDQADRNENASENLSTLSAQMDESVAQFKIH